jgi:hypothetical protein
MRANCTTSLRRRPSGMTEYDRLPAPLRAWLAQAALPWSIRSVRRIWARHRNCQDALRALAQIEAASLRRDAPQIWGETYPTFSCRKYSQG